jgi:hypothetical protein
LHPFLAIAAFFGFPVADRSERADRRDLKGSLAVVSTAGTSRQLDQKLVSPHAALLYTPTWLVKDQLGVILGCLGGVNI